MEEEKKETYLQKLATKILEWDKKFDTFSKDFNVKAEEEFKKFSEDFKIKSETAKERLQQLKKSGTEGWEELSTGTEKAIDELSKAINNAIEKFKSGEGVDAGDSKPEAGPPGTEESGTTEEENPE